MELPPFSTVLPPFSTVLPPFSILLPLFLTVLHQFSILLPLFLTVLHQFSTVLPPFLTVLPQHFSTLHLLPALCLVHPQLLRGPLWLLALPFSEPSHPFPHYLSELPPVLWSTTADFMVKSSFAYGSLFFNYCPIMT